MECSRSSRDRAESLLGDGYIYGASGQTCSEAFRRQQANQYPEYEDVIMNTGKKWDGKRVWDCATFTREVAKAGGVTIVAGATSQWTKTNWKSKGEISEIDKSSICFLYKRQNNNPNKMSHTGFYLGDGYFIHARGTKYGVIKEDLASYKWTHWAIPYWGESEEEGGYQKLEVLCKAKVKSENGGNVYFRREPNKASTKLGSLKVGTVVDVVEKDVSKGWDKIQLNGSIVYMMNEFLKYNDFEEDEEMVSFSKKKIQEVIDLLKQAQSKLE